MKILGYSIMILATITIVGLRFIDPALTETQLFLEFYPLYGSAVLALFIGYRLTNP